MPEIVAKIVLTLAPCALWYYDSIHWLKYIYIYEAKSIFLDNGHIYTLLGSLVFMAQFFSLESFTLAEMRASL